MNTKHLIWLAAGLAVGYLAKGTLIQYKPWQWAYTKGAEAKAS